eukprot:GHVP01006339.1.p1 GENE.GHVP01006339.1~~GHVP01006339.1.p1  ORF type:complete len:183 (-),score=18.72 GHVP01006339.1:104-628(-)
MEFFKNVSDELANAFVGHYPNVEYECQQSHGLSFRADSGSESESDSEPTQDLQTPWDLSNVPFTDPNVVVMVDDWTAEPQTKVRFVDEVQANNLLLPFFYITGQTRVTDIHCEIRDENIIISWVQSKYDDLLASAGLNQRYFWYMSEEQARIEKPDTCRHRYYTYFQELMTLQN